MLQRPVGVLVHGLLGHLEPQVLGRGAALLQRLLQRGGEALVAELAGGDVDGDHAVPLGRAAGGLAQDVAAERRDEARGVGDPHELRGIDLPPPQRLEPADRAAPRADDGLVAQLERPVLDRLAQVLLQLEPGADLGVQPGVEHGVPRRALRLGAVHGHVGVADQVLGVGVAARRARCRSRSRP